MRLKSFSTYGFKSFAEKTEIKFDKGITAVVGPNGSGKSNISDAIRWVLGEQSAKYLRGSKMEDVIFSGSSKRRALGVAEVTVDFDNTDGTLPLDFEQVSITRRLFRSGDSDYAINKKNCRLRDIIDLLADTGLGKGSMSIISQNKIDEILNSRPEERRSIFEEAAGIAKYRLRKKDALKRLDDTAVNLTRISDIRSEVDAQVEPLAQAAAKTQQFNAFSEELRLCRLTVLLHKLDNMQSINNKLLAQKDEAANEFAQQAAAYSRKQAELAAIQRDLDKLAESYTKLQDAIKNKETTLEKLRGQQDVLTERIIQSEKAGVRLDERDKKLEEQAAERECQMQSLADEFDTVDKERIKAQLLTEKLQGERDIENRRLQDAKEQNTAAQSDFFADMQTLLKLRNELHQLEQEQEQRVRRRDALKKSIVEVEEAQEKSEEQYNGLLEKQARNAHELELLEKNYHENKQAKTDVQKRINEITTLQQECQRRLTEVETAEQSLTRLQAAYDGFGFGSRVVLKAQEPWKEQVCGVVAELISVEDKYVAAIETALGDGAQNIVTADVATAKQAIKYLKGKGGRATFLPLDNLQIKKLKDNEVLLKALPGVCGYAIDLVSCDKHVDKAIRFLLGTILVAENMDAALAAAKASNFRIRVVTLAGDVVNVGGSLTGGSRKHKEGYLTRNIEIKQARKKLKELHQEMLGLQEQLEEQEDNAKKLRQQEQSLNEELQQLRLRGSELKMLLEQTEQEKLRVGEKLALLLSDRKDVTNEYLGNRDKLKNLREQVSEYETKDASAKVQLEELNKQIAQYGSNVTALDNKLQDAKVLLETSTAKVQYINERMQGLDYDTLQIRDEIAANDAEKQRLQKTITACQEQKIQLKEEEETVLLALRKIMSGKDDFADKRSSLLNKQYDMQQEGASLKRKSADSESVLRQLELDLTRHNSDYNHAKEQLAEEYQLQEDEARRIDLSAWQGKPIEELQKAERNLTVKISDLGPINAAAIEEYQAVKERSEFLRKQYDDLCIAKENLETVISDINSGMVERFQEAFAKINEYFAQCYIKLFGGGTAVLKLTEPENILDSGIDIEVQPPGKKLQSLYLLSGGERALTVIALLFALLSYLPSPFCVLDEIDAALDDANIQRFANFLREYAADTQFIIITHRKGTMEAADVMYGVTMEESGVSTLLSVKINAKES
ncbi:MAG: chromosome segregation protein SMC [Phascolarctobacterium sp.]